MKKKHNKNQRNKKLPKPILYTEAEIFALEKHITTHFGNFANVVHEIISPDIHVDIAIIEPTNERNFYTLVTMGMGAHRMNVPQELTDYKLDRAEMVVCLPPDWKVMEEDEKWYWPLRWLKILARLPIENKTWLGFGHTVPNGAPFADNTKLSGVVNFYQMLPLHEEEMNFKIANDFDALIDRMPEDVSVVVNINRPSVV